VKVTKDISKTGRCKDLAHTNITMVVSIRESGRMVLKAGLELCHAKRG